MRKKINIPKLDDLLLAYETGIHIGDGCIPAKQPYSVYYCGNMITDSDFFSNVIPDLMHKLYGINPRIKNIPEEKSIIVVFHSVELVDFKINLVGLPHGSKSFMKDLPNSITKFGDEHVKQMIKGIFDTDGCFKTIKKEGKLYPRATIKSKSLILNDVKQFLEKHKVPCNINKDKTTLVYCLYVNGNKNVDKFFDLIKPLNKKHTDKYAKWLKIRSNKELIRARSLVRIERLN
jgi:hypothetical protein